MTPLLSLVLIVLIAFIGSFIAERVSISSVWLKAVTFSGIFYILLGYLIGPDVFQILTVNIIQNLNVLFSLVLGWVGFLIGIQITVKGLRRFPRIYYFNSLIQYFFIFTLLSVIFYFLFTFLIPSLQWQEILLVSLAGTVTSPILIGVMVRDYRVKGRIAHWLQFNAAFDNLLGVVTIGVLFLIFHIFLSLDHGGLHDLLVFVLPIGITVVCIFLYQTLFAELKTEQEKFLLFIGLLLVSIGGAYYFKQSILFNSFLFGIGLASSNIATRKLYQSIQQIEKPLYVILLVFAGMNLRFQNNSIALLMYMLIIFIGVRMFIKLVAGLYSVGGMREQLGLPYTSGLANLGMGGLSLAILLDYLMLNPDGAGSFFLVVIVIAIVINDLISFRYLQKKVMRQER